MRTLTFNSSAASILLIYLWVLVHHCTLSLGKASHSSKHSNFALRVSRWIMKYMKLRKDATELCSTLEADMTPTGQALKHVEPQLQLAPLLSGVIFFPRTT